MKKLLTLTLAALMLLTSLTSCRMPERTDPFKEILEENPNMELPKSEVMEVDPDTIPKYEIEDSVKDYDDEQVIEIPADGDLPGGELVVKYKICNYGDNNLALVSVENHSEQALSISIDGVCENTLEERSKTINREFEGFAANWQNYFVFYPTMEFDEFSYEINFEPYDGETYGQYVTNLEWDGIWVGCNPGGYGEPTTSLTAFWFCDYTWNKDNWYSCDFVLFDAEGDVLSLGMSSLEDVTFLGTQKRKAMGPLAPNSQYDRKPFYYPIYHDKSTPWAQVTLDPDGEHLSHWDHPVDETDYELPEPFKNAYGIIAWNDMLGPNRPTVTLPEGYGKS